MLSPGIGRPSRAWLGWVVMSQNTPSDDGDHQPAEPVPGAANPGPVPGAGNPDAADREVAADAADREPGPDPADQAQAGGAQAGGAGETGAHTPEPDSGQQPAGGGTTARTRIAVGVVFAVLCLGVAGFFAVVGPASAAEPGLMGTVMRWATPVIWVALAGVAAAWAAGANRKIINTMASVVLGFYLLYLIARSL